MIIVLLVFIAIIVFERFIYLNDFAAAKKTKKNTDKPNNNLDELEQQCELIEDYKRQFYPDHNYGLLMKYIFQYVLLFTIMYMVFWYFPNSGNKKLTGSTKCTKESRACNEVTDNPWTVIFYFIWCLYFYISARQIRDGWPEVRNMNSFRKKESLFNYLLVSIYLSVPYLFEINLLMDWAFTKTSLTIFQWFKLDDLYSRLYISKYLYKSYNPLGKAIKMIIKYSFSILGMLAFIFLIVGPMALFSSLNPMSEYNNINGAQIFFGMRVNNEINSFNLFSGSQVLSLTQIAKSRFRELNLNRVDEIKSAEIDIIQEVEMQGYSDSEWQPTPQAKKLLLAYLNSTSIDRVSFYLSYSFKRSYQPKYTARTSPFLQDINSTTKEGLYNAISSCSNYSVRLHNFYYKIIALPAESQAYELTGEIENTVKESATVILNCTKITFDKDTLSTYSWELKTDHKGIFFITLSEKITSLVTGYTALTLYISVVFVIGVYMKAVTRNKVNIIIIHDMPETGGLLDLCEGVMMYRLDDNLKMEGELYFTLIDLFRSPEVLKIITESSLESIKKKKSK